MNDLERTVIERACSEFGNDRHRMLDIVRTVQRELNHVSGEAMSAIAQRTGTDRVSVESVVTFYAFISDQPQGRMTIRLCNDYIDKMFGFERIARTFEEELGITIGETTDDGLFTLETTACIGMCDQAPAALVNDVVITNLTTEMVRETVRSLKQFRNPSRLVRSTGDGNNALPIINAMVRNNIRLRGPVVFSDFNSGEALGKGLALSPMEVIRNVKAARLRGRGGAGFPTGMKWEFARAVPAAERYIVCNADEGEPGTFKDRVILTERADLMIEGMTLGGYSLGAKEGIIYLRGEYAYLRPHLEKVLQERRRAGLLGEKIMGRNFSFDVRIQMGAGSYVCGAESALINSCEGYRGDPRNRPPFPTQKGYRGMPTAVNNVETLCKVAKIMERGAGWFAQLGSKGSTGTKLLSISGDCELPGVYEVPYGIRLREILKMAGAVDTHAVMVGGPSGQIIGEKDFDRNICYDDLGTGGALMVFDRRRSILEIVESYTEFFIDESCGYCTPCRVGNMLLLERLHRIVDGLGVPSDVSYISNLAETIRSASRCGLGQTSANPLLSSLKNFRDVYDLSVSERPVGIKPTFDIHAATENASEIAGRESSYFPHD